MKKNGFTLAEVLITLTIIGVVAALTLPSLNMGVQSSKVGPHLRKFINTISNANEMILMNNQSNTLRGVYPLSDDATNENSVTRSYLSALTGQVRGSVPVVTGTGSLLIKLGDSQSILKKHPISERQKISGYNNSDYTNDFREFRIMVFDSGECMAIHLRKANEQQRGNANQRPGVFADVLYDMDGFSAGANRLGIDIFAFIIENRGVVIPNGSIAQQSYNFRPNIAAANSGVGFAGLVADNNWRVPYEY